MALSSTIFAFDFKSPLRCLCRSFHNSRNRWRSRAKLQVESIDQLRQQIRLLQQRNQALQSENDRWRLEDKAPVQTVQILPQWTNLPGHQFSAEIISLCCQLSMLVGFRAVPKVLQCVADMFQLSIPIPSRDAVRNWSCRNGIAMLQQPQRADDWVWMIDHSVQLGKMFVLIVLGIAQSKLPIGRPLRREDMTPLAVMPTKARDKDEVARQLIEVAEQFGTPMAIVSDGARELHEGAQSLKTLGFTGVHLDDIKHKVSNLLKKKLGADERFNAFLAKLGQTSALIQQTELDHLIPPRRKEKCRFMSFHRIIDWATMVEHELAITGSSNTVAADRLQEKLGWVKDFEVELNVWRECRHLVGHLLRYANDQGVFPGASEALRSQLAESPPKSPLAQSLSEEMISYYQSNENQLLALPQSKMRLPCSTEVLESAFGSFKALQRHHARGTFTSLLAVFPTLFDQCTPAKIRQRFSLLNNGAMKAWLKTSGLTNSTQSRRTKAYTHTTPKPETTFSIA